MYAQVALTYASSFIDRPYTYLIPEGLTDKIQIGSQVLIPFGKRKEIGYIVEILKELKEDIKGIKSIEEVRGGIPFFSKDTVETAKWMSEYYISFFGSALRTMMMPGIESYESKTGKRRLEIDGTMRSLGTPGEGFSVTLLFGPSGSGKTKHYIEAINKTLSKSQGAVVLLPEISFSNKLVLAIKEAFPGIIAVMHSSISQKELTQKWKEIYSGKIKVVLGTRTALFAPVKSLGLIILDEEEGYAYKQEQNPKYHSREAAVFIAKQKRIPLIMGSGCPTIETYHKAVTKEIVLKRTDDTGGAKKPDIEIVDMRRENKQRFGILSKSMVEAIRDVLASGGKAALFINRRGFAPFLVCDECGKPVLCPNCSVSLNYHASDKSIHCQKCGFSKAVPVACPNCLSSEVRFVGMGTQKVEREIARYFPTEKVLRLDKDIADVKKSQDIVIKMFAEGQADILIGTQMAVRALETAQADLAGIVSADVALGTPDFRSAESTFGLIMDVSGRSKRINAPKKVLIQTYDPENYVFSFAKKCDYQGFYEKELLNRKESGYPPFGHIISIIIYGKVPASGQAAAEDIAERILSLKNGIEVLGPVQTSLAKVRGRSRWQILIKGQDLDIIKDELRSIISDPKYRKDLKISVDVDPVSIM